ncbi:MAG: hypothetical protein ACYDAA_17555 [Syntrophales bacterium]
MKKLVVLLIVAVGLLGLSTGAFAQALDVCNSCKGGTTLGTIACVGEQSTCVPAIFNYQTRSGYSGVTSPYTMDATPYRAIFNVCNCTNAGTTFVTGHRIGIRMTILVNGTATDTQGAYWADSAATTVDFRAFAQPADTCVVGAWTATSVKTFGLGSYYKADGTTAATPTSASPCATAADNRAVIYQTNADQGYTIQATDETLKLSRWWINIPNIRVDPATLHNGEVIAVKIETLDQSTGGICALCVATCECTIEVAKVCPQGGASSCLFPYFTSTTAANGTQPYWNGIAIVNTGSTAGTATLKVYQKDGSTGTFTTPSIPAKSMYVAALENVGFTGTGLGDQPLYINVTSTFGSIDGFAMIANTETGESMGYLCRK